jgi:hypothetical protein
MTERTHSEDRTLLTDRLRTLLPETYRDRDDIQPHSMGSAGLKYTCNLFPRREETTVFVPINTKTDPGGHQTAQAIARARIFLQQQL